MPKILLVEDNELNRDMLSRRLSRSGFSVVAAVDGPEGIRMARDERPDLILMDVALGEMDGWEATLAIKADPEFAVDADRRADRACARKRSPAKRRSRLRRLRHQAGRLSPIA